MKFIFLMFLSTCIVLFSQQITLKKLVDNPHLKIENLKVVSNFSTENMQQIKFLTISGILVTDFQWEKQNILIEIKNNVWRDQGSVVYQKVEVLPTSKKNFSIYLKPLEGAYTAKIHFKIANKIIYQGEFPLSRDNLAYRIMYVAPKNYASNINYLLPVMSEAANEKFKQNSWQQPTVQVYHILPEDLPVYWQGYTCADLVIINSDRPFLDMDSSISKKSQALLSWLYMGGKIIVSSGSSLWPSNSNFMRVLFDIDNIKIVNAPDTNIPNFPAKENYIFSHPQKSSKYQDVYWYMPRGYGEVIYLGADIAKYGAVKEAKDFWKEHLELGKAKDLLYNDQSVDLKSRDFTKDRAPILWIISIFVLFYLIIVGPINFSFFRRRGKTIYLIISIPLIAIIFSVFLLFYGFASKGVTNYAKKLSFIYPLENSMCYSKDCLVISSGSRNLYDIKGKENTIVSVFNEENSNNTINYEQNQGAISIVNYPLNLWELGFFSCDTVQQDFLFSMSRTKENKIDCKIDENVKILQAYFITGNMLYEISDLKNDLFILGREIETRNMAKSITSRLGEDLPYHIQQIVSAQIMKFLSKNRGKDVVIAFLDKEIISLEVNPGVTVDREVHMLMDNIKNGK